LKFSRRYLLDRDSETVQFIYDNGQITHYFKQNDVEIWLSINKDLSAEIEFQDSEGGWHLYPDWEHWQEIPQFFKEETFKNYCIEINEND
jgi:hypothetical protein